MPKIICPLSDTACKAAKPQDKLYRLFDGNGLYLEVHPSGQKYWRMKYNFGGKEYRLSFGVYPDVTLNAARNAREDARALLRQNTNPSQARKEGKLATAVTASNSFEAIAREWHAMRKEQWSENYATDLMICLERDLFPHIGALPITAVSPMQLLEVLKKVEKRGALEVMHRAKQMCSRIFRYAIATGRAERDPARDIGDGLKPVKRGHHAAIESRELPALLSAIESYRPNLTIQTQDALDLLLLTFVRTSELIQAKWEEFDFDRRLWLIPAERMKMRRDHLVPLSTQALQILEQMRQRAGNFAYLFPHRSDPKRHMSNVTVLRALERMGYKGKQTGHGFRALAMSTIKELLGYRHEVPKRQLAHAPGNKIDAAYDRAAFLPERTKMMQEWADYLENTRLTK